MEPVTITIKKAVSIIRQHGNMDEIEDFFKTLGKKKVYKLKDVKEWLGYQKGKRKMAKYKVKLTFIEEVEATSKEDAIIIAYDGVIESGYTNVKVKKIESEEE